MSVRKAQSLLKVDGNGEVVSVDFDRRGIMEREAGEGCLETAVGAGGPQTAGRKEGTASTEDIGVWRVLAGGERNGKKMKNMENLLTIEQILNEKSCFS